MPDPRIQALARWVITALPTEAELAARLDRLIADLLAERRLDRARVLPFRLRRGKRGAHGRH